MAKGKKEELTIEEKLEQALVPEDEQPYEIPDNWVWVKLGRLFNNVQYGYTAKSSTNNIGPKMLRITDIQDDFVNWDDVPFCKISKENYEKYKININDIVIARTGATTGKSFLITENVKAVFASYLIRVLLKKEFNHKLLYYYMHSDYYWNQITELAQGIAQPGVNATKLQSLDYPFPPIAEQQRIVDRIESLFEMLDQAKELAQNTLDTFETRKAAILHKAFTGELTIKWREINGVNMDSWKKKNLISIFKFIDYRGKTPVKTDHGIPLITAKNVKKGYIDYRIQEFISPEEFEGRKSRGVAQKGDILITTEAPLGNVCLADLDIYSTAQRVIVLQQNCNFKINNKCIMYYMLTDSFQEKLNQQKTGSTVAGIKAAKLKNVEVLLPTYAEQIEIACILDRLIEKEEKAKELCEDIIDKIDLMKKAILARAFRGELGTNDPSEESAIELLKECL